MKLKARRGTHGLAGELADSQGNLQTQRRTWRLTGKLADSQGNSHMMMAYAMDLLIFDKEGRNQWFKLEFESVASA